MKMEKKGSRKRKGENKKDGIIIDAKKQKKGNEKNDSCLIEKLPDDLLVGIVSRLGFKDAVKTSLLSRRWENLWKFTSGSLELDDRDSATWSETKRRRNFKQQVDHVLDLHQGTRIDSLIIRFASQEKLRGGRATSVDNWIFFAMLKEAKRFELDLPSSCNYRFPQLLGLLVEFPSDKWSTLFYKSGRSSSRCLRSLGAFCSLRSLRLVGVHIKDEVVRYFLASCHYIEELCIKASNDTMHLEIVDPLPNLKELEISDCSNIQSLLISVASLVSCTYRGRKISSSSPIFKNNPNLSKLTLGGEFCESFIYQPNKHSSYTAQLVELVLNLDTLERERAMMAAPTDLPQLCALKRLELNIASQVNRSLVFFTSFIKASPQLQVLKMKIEYIVPCPPFSDSVVTNMIPFPEEVVVTGAEANQFLHENLKLVSMAGYCGCASEQEFLVQLSKLAPSLETVSIDTDCDYYLDNPDFNHFLAVYKLRRDGHALMRDWIKGAIIPQDMPRHIMTRSHARKHARKFKSTFPPELNFLIA